MSDLLVERSLEPHQEAALAHLAGVGVGRAIAVLGDMLGVRLRPREPVVRFVSLPDGARRSHEDYDEPWTTVGATFRGGSSGEVVAALPRTTVDYLCSRLGGLDAWRDESRAVAAVTGQEVAGILLNCLVDGFRPLLSPRVWFSPPRPWPDPAAWWREASTDAVGGVRTDLRVEDGNHDLELRFALVAGPRALDTLLFSLEEMAGGLR